MGDQYLADRPINREDEDQFQRYGFSRRIAETILGRTGSDSIVIGLYGAWGEGKTSVINFIKRELDKYKKEVIHFTFNPWRFIDESALLSSFFNTLAKELRTEQANSNPPEPVLKPKEGLGTKWLTTRFKRVTKLIDAKKEPLKTRREAIGDLFQNYGKAVSMLGVGELTEVFGKMMSNVDVDELKRRIEELLLENRKRIVVFIDDIDRLEKSEIHAIFRLVKLTGDFPYTTYVLSFDENMVATAIGERFGSGDQKAGFKFLEKIIQIPLKLPLAQTSALKNYCLQLVEQSMRSGGIELSEEESREFIEKFSSNYLNRLSTPRLAVRYGNSLSFSIPLLKGEVSYVDLLLIEAVKIFYPEVYDFVRDNPYYFTQPFANRNGFNNQEDERTIRFKYLYEQVTSSYTVDDIGYCKGALKGLFPTLRDVWGSGWDWQSGLQGNESRYLQKRVSTSQYFDRYFTYAVIKGDISDVAFDQFIQDVANGNYNEMTGAAERLIETSSPDTFIQKIRSKEKTFTSQVSINLIKIISLIGHKFPNDAHYSFWTSPLSQAAVFLAQLLKYQVQDADKFDGAQWVIQNAVPFRFAYEIFNFCRQENDEGGKIFSHQQNKELAAHLINRAKLISADKPLWEPFTFESKYMIRVWAYDFDKPSLWEYVAKHLELSPKTVVSLLKVYVGYIKSSAYHLAYYGDFDKKAYNQLINELDPMAVLVAVQKNLDVILEDDDSIEYLEHEQTDENLMRQFLYWHNRIVSS